MPGEDLAKETVGGAWDTMGPGAALFILLLVIVVGMFFLAWTWMRSQARDKPDSKTPVPVTKLPGYQTMMGLMRVGDVRSEQAALDAKQASEIEHLQLSLRDTNGANLRMRSDLMKISNRVSWLESRAERDPHSSDGSTFGK